MTECIDRWLENDFTDASWEAVQSRDLIEELWRLITRMDREKRIKVLFWEVPREKNADAHKLANAALDTAGPSNIWDFENPPTQREADEYVSERVWRWHARLDHIPLQQLQAALRASMDIDLTRERI
ncbi:hypothetical protein GGR58DRAFT_485909 [Xylaria digitata]|nr:hypothetical protein GGR58DRAFT_485909 [Xylaria digitata]